MEEGPKAICQDLMLVLERNEHRLICRCIDEANQILKSPASLLFPAVDCSR
jgi:hypothetical protein